jgi:AhpD family alkylhydroperoxidase
MRVPAVERPALAPPSQGGRVEWTGVDGVAAGFAVSAGSPSHRPAPGRQWCVTTTAEEFPMDARLNLFENLVAAKFLKHIVAASQVVSGSGLPGPTQELVKLRASQINGCGVCTDMHTKDATAAGETAVRLNLVAAWREATVFTEAERAALELTEQGTRIADAAGGVSDEVWATAAKYYDEDQLSALVSLIALINTFNRVNVITRQPAGDYQPGQWG